MSGIQEVEDFWAEVSNTDWGGCVGEAYMAGFVEAAMEVWDEAEADRPTANKRLLQQIQHAGEEDEQFGLADGRKWAAETATPDELSRLREDIDTTLGGDYPEFATALAYTESPFGGADGIVAAVSGEWLHKADVEAFWDSVIGDHPADATTEDLMVSDRYRADFVEGAMAGWDETASAGAR